MNIYIIVKIMINDKHTKQFNNDTWRNQPQRPNITTLHTTHRKVISKNTSKKPLHSANTKPINNENRGHNRHGNETLGK